MSFKLIMAKVEVKDTIEAVLLNKVRKIVTKWLAIRWKKRKLEVPLDKIPIKELHYASSFRKIWNCSDQSKNCLITDEQQEWPTGHYISQPLTS